MDEHTFQVVQEIRSHRHRPTVTGKVSIFSGKVFCADCGAKLDIVTLKRRDEDLDVLFKRIYEDMVAGRLSPERFDRLSTQYEEEQKQVQQAIGELQALIDDGEQEAHDLRQFLKSVRKYTDPEELTAEMLNELVDKVIIHAPDKSSGHRRQKIEIY